MPTQAAGRPVTPTFDSLALRDIPVPDHADVILVPLPEGASTDPTAWAEQIFDPRSAPRWVKALFRLRETLVGLIGVERGAPGTFAVDEVSGQEALIAANERHLDFRAAVGVDPVTRLVRVTTTVRLHGRRGRIYFAPVRLLHAPILLAMLTRAARQMRRPTA